eukprot:365968-Chlamydomonas_euryale.AAC.19
MQYGAARYIAMLLDTAQYSTLQCDAYDAVHATRHAHGCRCAAMQYGAVRCGVMRYDAVRATQHAHGFRRMAPQHSAVPWGARQYAAVRVTRHAHA